MNNIRKQNSRYNYNRKDLIEAAKKVGAIIDAAEKKQRDYELQRIVKQISVA